MNVMDAINNRRSVRSYSPNSIPAEVMERMRRALRLAPSACNLQPWHFVMVNDPEIRTQLATAAKNQMWIADAPVIVVGCGLVEQAYRKMGGSHNSIDIDIAIAFDHLSLAAVQEGLGTCWIGAFDEASVKRVLDVPAKVKVVAIMPLGYPSTSDLLAPCDEGRRKDDTEIFSTNKYAGPRD